MAKPNKQHDARAASFLRMAKDHRACAKAHKTVARDKTVVFANKILHRAIAMSHDENAAIFHDEAKRLRAMR